MEINKWYNDKLNQFGENDFRSLNWGDKKGNSAYARYGQMFDLYNWSDKTVFEVGCGWGSFFDFGYTCDYYYGIDINKNFINIAEKNHQHTACTNWPKPIFETKDISDFNPNKMFDVAISTGVAGNRGGPAWHPNLLNSFLNKMYKTAQTILINFPSNRATIRSEHVEYFSPEYVLGQALNITENVQLIHKVKSDFLIILNHE